MYRRILLTLPLALRLCAQENTDAQGVMLQIVQRLDALERQNRELLDEVHALKQQLANSGARGSPESSSANSSSPDSSSSPAERSSINDRVTVAEHRIAEQAQTKVEASEKFPISLTGMLLFNAFANTGPAEVQRAGEYGLLTGPNTAGATVRQTILGLDFQGPALPGNGRVNGFLNMDFWGGSAVPSLGWLRIRRAAISLDWKNRSFTVGQDKPLISPYQPDSLAEVGIPPLAGAGNLWLWLPQARYEERLHLGAKSGLTGQVAVIQTAENYQTVSAEYSPSLELARPGLEGRLALWHKFDDVRRLEIAPSFHVSSTHVAGSSVPSRIGSLDWHITPMSKLEFSGTVYTGQNVAGLGALGNGFSIAPTDVVRPVHSSGGWSQLAFPLTSRITFNVFGGLQNDRATYLSPYSTVHNFTYASNVMYHLGPNVVVALEALQMRTRSASGIREIHNHYDLALGYLF
jgi:hypothetical protein